MSEWTGSEIALVIGAAGGFITVLTTSVVSIVGLWRLNTKIDGMLVERDKAKVSEGEQKEKLVGEEKAAILAQGQKEGRELASASASFGADLLGKQPLPVADERTAKAAEQTAEATGRLADETGKIASVAKDNLAKKP